MSTKFPSPPRKEIQFSEKIKPRTHSKPHRQRFVNKVNSWVQCSSTQTEIEGKVGSTVWTLPISASIGLSDCSSWLCEALPEHSCPSSSLTPAPAELLSYLHPSNPIIAFRKYPALLVMGSQHSGECSFINPFSQGLNSSTPSREALMLAQVLLPQFLLPLCFFPFCLQ